LKKKFVDQKNIGLKQKDIIEQKSQHFTKEKQNFQTYHFSLLVFQKID
jgi:hypothetical protein